VEVTGTVASNVRSKFPLEACPNPATRLSVISSVRTISIFQRVWVEQHGRKNRVTWGLKELTWTCYAEQNSYSYCQYILCLLSCVGMFLRRHDNFFFKRTAMRSLTSNVWRTINGWNIDTMLSPWDVAAEPHQKSQPRWMMAAYCDVQNPHTPVDIPSNRVSRI
jgi:hypothetical protein